MSPDDTHSGNPTSDTGGRSRRRRVLEISGSAAGGVRAHLGDCARLLSHAGYDVIVEAPADVLAGLDLGGARGEALPIGSRPSPRDSATLARLRRLGRRADVVHAHGLRAGAVAGLALGRHRTGRPRLVVTLHNLTVGGRLTRVIGERLERVVAAYADLVLVVSPDLAQRMAEHGARRVEIAVVPAPRRSRTGLAPHASSVESAWHGARGRLLTVARLAPQKGIDLLLDAAGILHEWVGDGELEPFVWAVAGEGPEEAPARARAADEDLPVDFLGRREDVPVLLEEADVVVQTSLWEGQPLTLQEAMRAGTAVVATDVGGTSLTAHGGAELVEPGAQALAAAVARLLGDDDARARAGARALAAARELPTSQDLADQLLGEVVGEVAGE